MSTMESFHDEKMESTSSSFAVENISLVLPPEVIQCGRCNVILSSGKRVANPMSFHCHQCVLSWYSSFREKQIRCETLAKLARPIIAKLVDDYELTCSADFKYLQSMDQLVQCSEELRQMDLKSQKMKQELIDLKSKVSEYERRKSNHKKKLQQNLRFLDDVSKHQLYPLKHLIAINRYGGNEENEGSIIASMRKLMRGYLKYIFRLESFASADPSYESPNKHKLSQTELLLRQAMHTVPDKDNEWTEIPHVDYNPSRRQIDFNFQPIYRNFDEYIRNYSRWLEQEHEVMSVLSLTEISVLEGVSNLGILFYLNNLIHLLIWGLGIQLPFNLPVIAYCLASYGCKDEKEFRAFCQRMCIAVVYISSALGIDSLKLKPMDVGHNLLLIKGCLEDGNLVTPKTPPNSVWPSESLEAHMAKDMGVPATSHCEPLRSFGGAAAVSPGQEAHTNQEDWEFLCDQKLFAEAAMACEEQRGQIGATSFSQTIDASVITSTMTSTVNRMAQAFGNFSNLF